MRHKKIDHLYFNATDLDAVKKFYTDVGFDFVQEMEHGARGGSSDIHAL